MPDEALITQIENLLAEIVELGGQNERSAIVPNLTVQDADPANLNGFVIVSDDRDGDNILAKKVGSVIYADNDLVNVMFLRGGEAIAFQQGSQSANNGIWEIVPSTTTDIFYDKGDVGIGKSVAPDAALEILDTAQAQLRLTFEEDVKFTTLTVDTSHDLTIDPSSTGLIKLAADVTITNLISHEGDLDTELAFTDDDVEITVGGLSMLKLTETGQNLITLGPGSGDVDIDFNGDMFLEGSSGNFGIGETSPSGIMHVKWATSAVSPRLEFTGAGNLPATYIFFHNSATPANNDGLGEFRFNGNNDAGTPEEIAFSRVAGFSPTITDGSEDGELRFTTMVAGTTRSVGRWIAGDLGIGNNVTPLAKLHIDQFSTSAAIPVTIFDQADVSEEMFEFVSTIGVGNAIEAVGAKVLTTTHFIKVTLPGALTRYFPVGTIA